MKKDNFDIRAFLAENKLTENSRGEAGRYHFGSKELNTGRVRVITENLGNVEDTDIPNDLKSDKYYRSLLEKARKEAVRDGIEPEWVPELYFGRAYKALKDADLISGNPEEDLYRIDDYRNDGEGYDAGYPEGWRENLDEAGYTDDASLDSEEDEIPAEKLPDVPVDAPAEDSSLLDLVKGKKEPVYEDFEDDEFSDPEADAVVDRAFKDRKARSAAERGIDADVKAAEKDDVAAAAADLADAPADDAPAEEPAPAAHPNRWVTGELSMNSLFGPDAENVDILVGDDSMSNDEALQYLFKKNKNYRPNLLQREVRSVMQYFRDYEKPDKIYLIPAIDRGGYIQSRFNAGNRAVAAVYRPESLSGQAWADQYKD